MQCDPVRDALSALLDGEDPGLDPEEIDRHVRGCAACAARADELATLHRMVRVREAEAVPDLTTAILGAHRPSDAPARRWAPAARPSSTEVVSAARWTLFVVGLTQLVLAAPSLLLLSDDAALHTTRELGAFDVALAVGFLVAAWQPARAWGLLPVAAALGLVMAGTAVVDVVGGAASGGGEAHHVLDLVGVVVLWRVAREAGAPGVARRPVPAR
jgi:predicted anti-sigma-YlaC factor YlaD